MFEIPNDHDRTALPFGVQPDEAVQSVPERNITHRDSNAVERYDASALPPAIISPGIDDTTHQATPPPPVPVVESPANSHSKGTQEPVAVENPTAGQQLAALENSQPNQGGDPEPADHPQSKALTPDKASAEPEPQGPPAAGAGGDKPPDEPPPNEGTAAPDDDPSEHQEPQDYDNDPFLSNPEAQEALRDRASISTAYEIRRLSRQIIANVNAIEPATTGEGQVSQQREGRLAFFDVAGANVADACLKGVGLSDVLDSYMQTAERLERPPTVLAKLYFAAMVANLDTRASDNLHAMLQIRSTLMNSELARQPNDSVTGILAVVVDESIINNIDPQEWINRYATTAEEIALLTMRQASQRFIAQLDNGVPDENLQRRLENELEYSLSLAATPDLAHEQLTALLVVPNRDLIIATFNHIAQASDEIRLRHDASWANLVTVVGTALLAKPAIVNETIIASIENALDRFTPSGQTLERLEWTVALQKYRGASPEQLITTIDGTIGHLLRQTPDTPPPTLPIHIQPDGMILAQRDAMLQRFIQSYLQENNFQGALALLKTFGNEDRQAHAAIYSLGHATSLEQIRALKPQTLENLPMIKYIFDVAEFIETAGPTAIVNGVVGALANELYATDEEGRKMPPHVTTALFAYVRKRVVKRFPNATRTADSIWQDALRLRYPLEYLTSSYTYEDRNYEDAAHRFEAILEMVQNPAARVALLAELAVQLRPPGRRE